MPGFFNEATGDLIKDGGLSVVSYASAPLGLSITLLSAYSSTPAGQRALATARVEKAQREENKLGGPAWGISTSRPTFFKAR